MNEFTASNGVRIRATNGQIKWAAPGSEVFGDLYDYASGSLLDSALAEMYRGREDERLGRWRVPGHPNWVCFATPHAYEVIVFNEDEPQYGTQLLSRGTDTWPYYRAAADAYFEAHPPKPAWHDAKPGEVWELTIDGGEPAAFYPSKSLDRRFTPIMPSTGTTAVAFDWPLITAGRRIWPEVS